MRWWTSITSVASTSAGSIAGTPSSITVSPPAGCNGLTPANEGSMYPITRTNRWSVCAESAATCEHPPESKSEQRLVQQQHQMDERQQHDQPNQRCDGGLAPHRSARAPVAPS